ASFRRGPAQAGTGLNIHRASRRATSCEGPRPDFRGVRGRAMNRRSPTTCQPFRGVRGHRRPLRPTRDSWNDKVTPIADVDAGPLKVLVEKAFGVPTGLRLGGFLG